MEADRLNPGFVMHLLSQLSCASAALRIRHSQFCIFCLRLLVEYGAYLQQII